jgi:hypothetical protein
MGGEGEEREENVNNLIITNFIVKKDVNYGNRH